MGIFILIITFGLNLSAAVYDNFDLKNPSAFAPIHPIHPLRRSVALVTRTYNLSPSTPNTHRLNIETYANYQLSIDEQLCEHEPFRNEIMVANGTGTGFLISPYILVTAGHVIENEADCDSFAAIFDFDESNKTALKGSVTNENIYYCESILKSQLLKDPLLDFSVILLDRPVFGREPLRLSNKVDLTDTLTMIGHPRGLLQKITNRGTLIREDETHIVSRLDTFPGNSGSPVFNQNHEVVGILVEGEITDTTLEGEWPEGCWYSKVYCDDPDSGKFPRCTDNEYSGSMLTKSKYVLETLQDLAAQPGR